MSVTELHLWDLIFFNLLLMVSALAIVIPWGFLIGTHFYRTNNNSLFKMLIKFINFMPPLILSCGIFLVSKLVLSLSSWWLGVLTLSLTSIPYLANEWDKNLREKGSGLWEAGRALGLGEWQVLRFIVFPNSKLEVMRLASLSGLRIFTDAQALLLIGLTDNKFKTFVTDLFIKSSSTSNLSFDIGLIYALFILILVFCWSSINQYFLEETY